MALKASPSWRQLCVYAAAAALVVLADPRPVTFAAGCCLVLAAWALRLWAFGHLDKNLHLVTTGPYAHTRNPAYLGSFLALLGVALAAGNAESTRGLVVWSLGAALAIAFFAVYLPRKFAREYGRLRQHFGEQLDRHAENVPNFWPRLWAWRSGDTRTFSWQRVGRNREWPWGIVFAMLMTAIWFAHVWSPASSLMAGQR